jgi:hypothetical protein
VSYSKIVEETLATMGTPASEWSAVPCVQTDIGPVFSFPTGYSQAPSPIRSNVGGDDCQCELCGHAIKTCYWLQNDSRRWTLIVGSECVTHFGTGESGAELAASAKKAMQRKFLGFARSIVAERSYEQRDYCAFHGLKKAVRGYFDAVQNGYHSPLNMTGPFTSVRKASTDREVSSWYSNRADKVRFFLFKLRVEIPKEFKA